MITINSLIKQIDELQIKLIQKTEQAYLKGKKVGREQGREQIKKEYNLILEAKINSLKRFAGSKHVLLELKQRFKSIT